ncbi:hypothetical protein ACFYQT_39725 [Streptomyces tibetensis]|uniref:Uncharacterized protein n=1 Tax=Streptomyces tibetensis TaxID=2382123 RepID=A0ABW6N8Q7_9ACTN
MTDHDPRYVDTLTTQLTQKRPDALRTAEDELQKLRGHMATITSFLRNEAIALDIRQSLAQSLHLPTPEK